LRTAELIEREKMKKKYMLSKLHNRAASLQSTGCRERERRKRDQINRQRVTEREREREKDREEERMRSMESVS